MLLVLQDVVSCALLCKSVSEKNVKMFNFIRLHYEGLCGYLSLGFNALEFTYLSI